MVNEIHFQIGIQYKKHIYSCATLFCLRRTKMGNRKSWLFRLRCLISCFLLTVFFASAGMAATDENLAPGRKLAQQTVKQKELWITADHSKFEILKNEFHSGPEVTQACLYCHTEASLQFHQTIHWTWMDPNTRDTVKLGKGGLSVNNF